MGDGRAEKLNSPVESLDDVNLGMGDGLYAQSHKTDLLDIDNDDLWCEDGSFFDGSNDGFTETPDLEREWELRRNQFYNIGYRDGLTAGKEAAAQEGFNDGFKQSVLIGYSWGLVRGVTSAWASLPDDLREKLVGRPEARGGFRSLHETVHSISSEDALKMFHNDIVGGGLEPKNNGNIRLETVKTDNTMESAQLGRFSKELECLLQECPIEVHPTLGTDRA